MQNNIALFTGSIEFVVQLNLRCSISMPVKRGEAGIGKQVEHIDSAAISKPE